MKKTTNYKLNKPELYEQFDINHFNDNADVIDSQMKKNEQAVITESINRDKAVLAEKKERQTADNNIINGTTPVTKVSDNATAGNLPIKKDITYTCQFKKEGWYRVCKLTNLYRQSFIFSIGHNFSEAVNSTNCFIITYSDDKTSIVNLGTNTLITIDKIRISYNKSNYYIELHILKGRNDIYLLSMLGINTSYKFINELTEDSSPDVLYYGLTNITENMAINGKEIATTDTSKATTQTDAFTQTYWNSWDTSGKPEGFKTGTYIGTAIEKSTQKYCKFIYSCDWQKNASYSPLEERGLVKDAINSVGTVAFKHTDGSSVTNLDCRVIKISDKFTSNLLTKLYSEEKEVATKTDIQNIIDGTTPVTKVANNAKKNGYELVTFNRTNVNNSDLNDIKKEGFYYGWSNITSAPHPNNIMFMDVKIYSGDWLIQTIYYPLLYGHPAILYRSYSNGKDWSKWEPFVTKKDLGDQKTFSFSNGTLTITDK